MEKLLKIKEAAKLLNINAVTLYQMVDRSEIPHLRMGKGNRTIRFEPKVIDEWIKGKQEKTIARMEKEV